MKIYNFLDEGKRFYKIASTREKGKQENIITKSYLFKRKRLEEMGFLMGLDKMLLEEEISLKEKNRKNLSNKKENLNFLRDLILLYSLLKESFYNSLLK